MAAPVDGEAATPHADNGGGAPIIAQHSVDYSGTIPVQSIVINAVERGTVPSGGTAPGSAQSYGSIVDRVISADGSVSHTYTPLTQVERTLYDATSATTNIATVDASMTQQFHNGIMASAYRS